MSHANHIYRKTLCNLGILLFCAVVLWSEDFQACAQDRSAVSIDEREFSFEDYRVLEKQPGSIIRPYRRQRNLMYRLQDALNKQGLKAGGRWNIWGDARGDPFRDALKQYQRNQGDDATGEITPTLVKNLLGIDITRHPSD
jgi:hypothetical protein